jgi:hypothetical protein
MSVPTTEVVTMTNSSKRLLFFAVNAMALVLAFAPVSFAGESSGAGPTQVGEIAAPVTTTQAPAQQTAPVAPAPAAPAPAPAAPVAAAPTAAPSTSHKSSSKGAVKGVSRTIVKKDTVRAKGGIQAGFGGMATGSAMSTSMTLALAGGILLILAAAAGYVPLARRSQD